MSQQPRKGRPKLGHRYRERGMTLDQIQVARKLNKQNLSQVTWQDLGHEKTAFSNFCFFKRFHVCVLINVFSFAILYDFDAFRCAIFGGHERLVQGLVEDFKMPLKGF